VQSLLQWNSNECYATVCVCVVLGIQRAICMHRIVISGPVPLYSIFPHCHLNGTIIGKTLLNIMFFPYNFYLKRSRSKKN